LLTIFHYLLRLCVSTVKNQIISILQKGIKPQPTVSVDWMLMTTFCSCYIAFHRMVFTKRMKKHFLQTITQTHNSMLGMWQLSHRIFNWTFVSALLGKCWQLTQIIF
jgi:hypothetical protein